MKTRYDERLLGLSLLLLFLGICVWHLPIEAACKGKIDAGPAYIHIDILESGHTVKKMNLIALKSDATIMLKEGKGWCLKPSVLYGNGQGYILSGALGLGHCFPINDWITLTPSVGCTFTELHTRIKLNFSGIKLSYLEKFHSTSPYLCLEATLNIAKGWRLCGMFQYAWSRTHTTIVHLLKDKSHTKGPNYGISLEYDINNNWSVNVVGAYNITLTKERHGLRGAGAKVGLAYWF